MEWIRRHWSLFSILVMVFSAGWIVFSPVLGNSATGGKIPAPREGFLAPDFALQDAQGKTVQLSDLRGKPVLLNLWATWCPPCQAEMPAMQKVHEQYGPQGFTILAVNTTYQDDRAGAIQYAAARGLTFPVLFDLDGSVSRKYLVRSLPTSFFIDKDGVIQKVVIGGPMSEALLRSEAESLLAEAR